MWVCLKIECLNFEDLSSLSSSSTLKLPQTLGFNPRFSDTPTYQKSGHLLVTARSALQHACTPAMI